MLIILDCNNDMHCYNIGKGIRSVIAILLYQVVNKRASSMLFM